MWQRYFCPDCGAPVVYGGRFCVNCGANLNQVGVQLPAQPSHPSCGYQYTNQQPEWYQQPGQNQLQPYNQAPAQESPNPCYEHRPNDSHDNTAQQKISPAADTITPIRTEILKLVAELFDKQIEDN